MLARAAEAFANTSSSSQLMSATGEWLDNPGAVLYATSAGVPTTAVLQLSNPRYDPVKHALVFHARSPCLCHNAM